MLNGLIVFIKSLSFIDYVFFFTVIFLLVLIVSLIYFVRINEEVIAMEDSISDPDNLRAINETIKKEAKPIKFTSYEKEQEDRAIISYDELLSNKEDVQINYVDEDKVGGDVLVKKIDLNNLVSPVKVPNEPKIEVHVISLQREEEFLKALKELQRRLN